MRKAVSKTKHLAIRKMSVKATSFPGSGSVHLLGGLDNHEIDS